MADNQPLLADPAGILSSTESPLAPPSTPAVNGTASESQPTNAATTGTPQEPVVKEVQMQDAPAEQQPLVRLSDPRPNQSSSDTSHPSLFAEFFLSFFLGTSLKKKESPLWIPIEQTSSLSSHNLANLPLGLISSHPPPQHPPRPAQQPLQPRPPR